MSRKVFIRALSLACYSSSLCYRLYPGSSAQTSLGFCCMQMTRYDTVESMEELTVQLKTLKAEMERTVLSLKIGKTKIMVSGLNLNLLKKKSGKNPCGVCQTGVGRNASVVDACPGSTRNIVESKDPDFSCAGCLLKARPSEGVSS